MREYKIVVCSYRLEKVFARDRNQAIENVENRLKPGETIGSGGLEEAEKLAVVTRPLRKAK